MPKRNYQDIIFDRYTLSTEEYIPQSGSVKQRLFNYYEGIGDLDERRSAIIWLHAGGGDFNDKSWVNDFVLRGYPFFSIDFGESGGGSGFDPANIIAGLINLAAFIRFLRANHGKYRVNGNRIIVTGVSFGGILSFEYNACQPIYKTNPMFASPINDQNKKAKQDIFASACFPGSCSAEFQAFVTAACVPVRAYHGTADTTLPIETTRKAIAQFQRINVDAILKEFVGATHKLEGLHDTIVADLITQLAILQKIPLIKPVTPA